MENVADFLIIKTSEWGAYPLESAMFISSSYVPAGLNGTLIRCRDERYSGELSLSEMGLEKTINVLEDARKYCNGVSTYMYAHYGTLIL